MIWFISSFMLPELSMTKMMSTGDFLVSALVAAHVLPLLPLLPLELD